MSSSHFPRDASALRRVSARRRALVIVLASVLSGSGGCAQILGLDADAKLGSGGSSTTGSGTGPTGTGPVTNGAGGACGDCTPADDCLRGTCVDGGCVSEPKAAREPCSAGVCDGAGSCVDCIVDDDCASDHYCIQATRQCAIKKTLGVDCTSSGECALGHCAKTENNTRICCTSDCSGSCESCLEAATGRPDGTCSPVSAGLDPKGKCAGLVCGSGTCDGLGACGYAQDGTPCSTGGCSGPSFDPPDLCDGAGQCVATPPATCAGSFVCDPMAQSCLTACSSQQDCISTHYCATPWCQMRKANGSSCQSSFECMSNNCSNNKCKP